MTQNNKLRLSREFYAREKKFREMGSIASEILKAETTKDKRAIVRKSNPHFYLMFPRGVKRYEAQTRCQDAERETVIDEGLEPHINGTQTHDKGSD